MQTGAARAMDMNARKSVMVCESQPVTSEGLRSVVDGCADLEFAGAADSPAGTVQLLAGRSPDVLILDKSFGAQALLETLSVLRTSHPDTGAVVWGISVTEAEALGFLQAGARGILRKSASLDTLLACLRAVAGGATWMEEDSGQERTRSARAGGPALTARERQVLELVAQGLKNREIGSELGIRPGTVKVHL
ncbi:MAG: response regulator transcription factor, partial [Acidobacteria bacterium]|nr:response regulator transcription factor [Acidobacteriota bacterium]